MKQVLGIFFRTDLYLEQSGGNSAESRDDAVRPGFVPGRGPQGVLTGRTYGHVL